jgi:hypothetical protein
MVSKTLSTQALIYPAERVTSQPSLPSSHKLSKHVFIPDASEIFVDEIDSVSVKIASMLIRRFNLLCTEQTDKV